jgi:hypothetical protein
MNRSISGAVMAAQAGTYLGKEDPITDAERQRQQEAWLRETLREQMQGVINNLLNQAETVKVRMDKLPERTLNMTRAELMAAGLNFEPYRFGEHPY